LLKNRKAVGLKNIVLAFFALSIFSLLLIDQASSQEVVPLYTGKVPNSISVKSGEILGGGGGIKFVRNVSIPSMSVYLPDSSQSDGSAVIIFPGGGYYLEAYEIEGIQIAQALVGHGIAAFVVKYRLPTDSTMVEKSIGPLQDAQQAIKVVRERAGLWRLNYNKVGIMGFSAGGHLASTAGTHFDRAVVPNKENISLRPDFMILVYPVISMTDKLGHMGSRNLLLGEHPSDSLIDFFSGEKNVTTNTPPAFLIHAEDDKGVDPDNSIEFFEALRGHDVPAELVIIPKGGHGFAANVSPEKWMQPVMNWMRDNGWMK
jgi:acetyl esterase/lipase